MPEDTAGGSPRAKPTTRSSIRNSLNLASVGKAFADVINKDSREANRNAKKAKDSSSRRLSTVAMKPSVPRSSICDSKPHAQLLRTAGTPDATSITRRRVSGTVQKPISEDALSKSMDPLTPGTCARPSVVRSRNIGTSALPKYRPKSMMIENKSNSTSPIRAGTRRRFAHSDDESEEMKDHNNMKASPKDKDKMSRPISPLPPRVALKSNLNNTVHATPPSTPLKLKATSPFSNRLSPSRPTKVVKTVATSSAAIAGNARPSSSASSVSIHTPKSSTKKLVESRNLNDKGKQRTPTIGSSFDLSRESPSLEVYRRQQILRSSSPTIGAGNMSHISERDNEDSEEDIEQLLAPVAAIGAPTPSMPRKLTSRPRKFGLPHTPTRDTSQLPTRANMSYVSPVPPYSSDSTLLRTAQKTVGCDRVARGSILSWEQLAFEASRTIGEEEIDRMLSDVSAPFQSGTVSPCPSNHTEIPESPCLSVLNSPTGGYGPISQVLLPNVTPSPGVYTNSSMSRFKLSPDDAKVDSSTAILLRLQLAAAENLSKERLQQMQVMEAELHGLKEALAQQLQDSSQRIFQMEAHEGSSGDEKDAFMAELQNKLTHVQAMHAREVEDTLAQFQDDMRKEKTVALINQRKLCALDHAAITAISSWKSVVEFSEHEHQLIQGDRDVLSVLLGDLDQMYRSIAC